MLCRSCSAPVELVLSLGDMPLPNSLLGRPSEPYSTYPLDLMFCPACKLGQLAEIVQPVMMFHNYPYYSCASGPTVDSAEALVRDILNDPRTRDNRTLYVEIGSNDGYLLQHYQRMGKRVLGIDPAGGPANAAALRGIPTVQDFFTLRLARTLPKADVIHANNVLAHVPDLNDFVAGIAAMLKPDGVVIVEVPYLGDLVEKCAFDTIYHEHSYYFSITAAVTLFFRHGLQVDRVERLAGTHGGSLRLFFKPAEVAATAQFAVGESFDFAEMKYRMDRVACELQDFLTDARSQGKHVWGYGAAAKATIMLNYCGVDYTLIEAVADTTPAKQGKFIPGTGIPIRSPQQWLDAAPDLTCIFAWNYANFICNRYATEYKGTMFTPYALPERAMSA